MIALVAASAVAGPRVDVLYDYQWARTSPVVVSSEDRLAGVPVPTPVQADRTPLDSGVAVEVLFEDLFLLSVGARGYVADYDVSGFQLSPRVWDVRVDGGGHAWFGWRGEPLIDGYIAGAAGLQGTMLRVEPWPTTLTPALHGFTGMGLANRRGRVRLRVEARLSLGMRFDVFEGRAQLPNETLVFRHHPGSATASILFGLGFGPGAAPGA